VRGERERGESEKERVRERVRWNERSVERWERGMDGREGWERGMDGREGYGRWVCERAMDGGEHARLSGAACA
jgi:hypothetical protein